MSGFRPLPCAALPGSSLLACNRSCPDGLSLIVCNTQAAMARALGLDISGAELKAIWERTKLEEWVRLHGVPQTDDEWAVRHRFVFFFFG